MQTGTPLPAPSSAALVHGQRVRAMLLDRIAATGGFLGFADYMAAALYTPGLGYYRAGVRKFGAGGDFITAPMVSSAFSRSLARQCAQVLEMTGRGNILEFGAGTGRMAADILLELERLEYLPDSYQILDISTDLRQRQEETLQERAPHLKSRVRWLQQTPDDGFRGVILGNELLDAMPTHRVAIGQEDGPAEIWVEATEAGFRAVQGPLSDENLVPILNSIRELWQDDVPPHYVTEINLHALGWIASLAQYLSHGAALLIDYGYPRTEYYHRQRDNGTLMCHYRHRAHENPFLFPGLQDLTAHVDFSTLAWMGSDNGLDLAGYTTQLNFLINCGIEDFVTRIDPKDTVAMLRMAQEIKTLTMPSEMGERFKVIAFGRGLSQPLMGFLKHDMRTRL